MPETVETGLPYHLRQAPERAGAARIAGLPATAPRETANGEGSALLCRHCGRVITDEHERMTAQGLHQHTFANPHGLVFTIGCFRSAAGCAYRGPLTTEWTWFKGFSWRMAHCRCCRAHLGWRYISPGGESFHGLILNQLVSARKGADGNG